MPALLAIDDLHVSFATDRGRTAILHGISLELEPGQTIGVVGESGSGKTVLVRAVLGLLDAPFAIDGGRIEYEGANLLEYGEGELERIRGRNIALTTPDPRKHLNPLTTIGKQIARVIRAHSDVSKKAAMARAVELLGMVGIPDPELRLAGYPHEMSGGMCQRIIIAMALAHDSKILLIDEPTAGLDVTISRQILDLIRGLVRDRRGRGADRLAGSRRRRPLLPRRCGDVRGPDRRAGRGEDVLSPAAPSLQRPAAARRGGGSGPLGRTVRGDGAASSRA